MIAWQWVGKYNLEKKFTNIRIHAYLLISADADSQQQMDWEILGQQAWCATDPQGRQNLLLLLSQLFHLLVQPRMKCGNFKPYGIG